MGMHFSALSLSCSVPTFQGLQEDILSKLADVLEEVKGPSEMFLNLYDTWSTKSSHVWTHFHRPLNFIAASEVTRLVPEYERS